MLVKATATTISQSSSGSFTPSNYVWTYSTNTWQKNNASVFSYSEERRATLFIAPYSWSYTITLQAQQNSNMGCKFWFWPNANRILTEITPTDSLTSYTFTVSLKAWETLYAYPYLWWAAYSNISLSNSSSSYTLSIIMKKDSDISWYSSQIYLIWDLWIITTFWINPNWEREFWPLKNISEFSTTATAGSITPWNYAWYLNIKGADWTIYKVWVYNL